MSTQEAVALLQQLDSEISGDDSIFVTFENFRVDNLNLQNASSSESSDSDAVEHCASNQDICCRHGRTQRRRINLQNLCNGFSNDKCLSSRGIIWTPMKLSCPNCRSHINLQNCNNSKWTNLFCTLLYWNKSCFGLAFSGK